MRFKFISILGLLAVVAALVIIFGNPNDKANKSPQSLNETGQLSNDKANFVEPISNPTNRTNKKLFGTKVSPADSPVPNERFTGFHTGTDYETFENEKNVVVEVYAICGGPLKQKRTASGYGGVAVQECLIDNQVVTVVYGHLNLNSVTVNVENYLNPGDKIGNLGEQGSETDNERKHLHLSIHKGTAIDIRGYVSSQKLLSEWIDPITLLKQ